MVNCVRLSTAGGRERERGHAILDACAAGGNSTAGRCSGVHAESRVQHESEQLECLVNEDFESRIQQPTFHDAPRKYMGVFKFNTHQGTIT